MRLLFTIDLKDYDPEGAVFIRPSVRAVILHGSKAAMVKSRKYNYYKFPGGGIEPGEDQIQALIRETAEETGLSVCPGSIREYGYVHRVQKGYYGDVFLQDNYYYLCQTWQQPLAQNLDEYEAEEGFVLEYVEPAQAIRVNRQEDHGPSDQIMLEREALVLEKLLEEGYFSEDL